MKKLIEHDGNGSITIDTRLAIGTFIILLLTAIIAIVSSSVNVRANIDENTNHLTDIKECTDDITEDINNHEKRLVAIETHYDHISGSLERIELKING